MRLVVFAYHDIGYSCLEELLRSGEEIAAVVTHRDDPNENIWFRSVADLARHHGIPVYEPDNVNSPEWLARLRDMRPDFFLSFYYRQILSAQLLALPSRGALNLHGSLLPRYRGRCPVNWALIHGESETGVTLHHMEERPDRGDIVAQSRVPIGDTDTAQAVFAKLTAAAATLIRDIYPQLRDGTAPRVPQDHRQATYFGGRRPEDSRIDWSWGARQIYNLIRAVTHPYPGAFTFWREKRLYIWEAGALAKARGPASPGTLRLNGSRVEAIATDGPLEVLRVQLQGEEEMSAADWLRHHCVKAIECE